DRRGAAQVALALYVGLGVHQQLAGGLGLAGGELLRGQGAGGVLTFQFTHALFVKRHVERGAVLLGLGALTAQHRNQDERQGGQQQQAGDKPEIDHGSFLSSNWERRSCSSADSRAFCGAFSTLRRRATITTSASRPPPSSTHGPYQSSRVRSSTGGL